MDVFSPSSSSHTICLLQKQIFVNGIFVAYDLCLYFAPGENGTVQDHEVEFKETFLTLLSGAKK